ncbi:hypothetical protein ACQR1I_26735 [Bradyrhizobium sp. HKCCYLS2038]|uniref:hypothetical protein n=1 Tax=unclassified Bradyrhizobium TaxID=2631580 RepID=UPI003EBB0E17
MTTLARAISRAFTDTEGNTNAALLKHSLLFCAALSFVAMLVMTYGLDLSPGLF